MAAFTYAELADEYLKNKKEEDIIKCIKSRFGFDSCPYKKQEDIKKKVNRFVSSIKKRYTACHHTKKKFLTQNKDWLKRELVLENSLLQSKDAKNVSKQHEESTDAVFAELRKVVDRVPEHHREKFQVELLVHAKNKLKEEKSKNFIA